MANKKRIRKRDKESDLGGTMRLGLMVQTFRRQFCSSIYKKKTVSERHRHRYEVNNKYITEFKKNGLIFSGMSLTTLLKY